MTQFVAPPPSTQGLPLEGTALKKYYLVALNILYTSMLIKTSHNASFL